MSLAGMAPLPREPLRNMLGAMAGVISAATLVAVFAAVAVAAGWVAVRLYRARGTER